MEDAALRQPGGIAPRPELVRKIVRAVALAGLGHQQCEVADRCGGNDCRSSGWTGIASVAPVFCWRRSARRRECAAGRCAPRRRGAAPYRARAQAQGAASSRSACAPRTRDLVLVQVWMTVRLRHLDRMPKVGSLRISLRSTPSEEVPEGLQPILRRVRRHGVDQRDNKFLRQRRERHMAMLLAESFEDGPTLRRRATREASEGLRTVILGDGGGDGAGLAALAGADRRRGRRRALADTPSMNSIEPRIPGSGIRGEPRRRK